MYTYSSGHMMKEIINTKMSTGQLILLCSKIICRLLLIMAREIEQCKRKKTRMRG